MLGIILLRMPPAGRAAVLAILGMLKLLILVPARLLFSLVCC